MPEIKITDNQLVEINNFITLFDYDTVTVRWCYSMMALQCLG